MPASGSPRWSPPRESIGPPPEFGLRRSARDIRRDMRLRKWRRRWPSLSDPGHCRAMAGSDLFLACGNSFVFLLLAIRPAVLMNFDKYTDRARGFVQSAQSLALRDGHQQFAPEHLLKVLLDDPEGLAAGLIDRAGGRSREALAAVEAALAKRPKVEGAGAGQL